MRYCNYLLTTEEEVEEVQARKAEVSGGFLSGPSTCCKANRGGEVPRQEVKAWAFPPKKMASS